MPYNHLLWVAWATWGKDGADDMAIKDWSKTKQVVVGFISGMVVTWVVLWALGWPWSEFLAMSLRIVSNAP